MLQEYKKIVALFFYRLCISAYKSKGISWSVFSCRYVLYNSMICE